MGAPKRRRVGSKTKAASSTKDLPESKLSVSASASQKLRNNFKELSAIETDSLEDAQGRSLRKRLEADIKLDREKAGSVTWGSCYYDQLRCVYEVKIDLHDQLKSVESWGDEAEEPSEKFVGAMAAALRKKPDRTKFMAFFTTNRTPLNLRETVGLLRWLSTLRPGCMNQLQFAQKGLAFVIRMKIHTLKPDHWTLMLPWLDGVVATLLRKARSGKISDSQFAKVNRGILFLMFAADILSCIEEAGANLEANIDQLSEYCRRFVSGRQLFLSKVAKHMCNKIENHIEIAIERCFFSADDPVGLEQVAAAKSECLTTIEALEGIGQVPLSREVSIKYRTTTAATPVTSISEEVDLRFAAVAKALATENDTLNPTFADDILCVGKMHVRPKTCQIMSELTVEAQAARLQLATMYGDACISSADDLQRKILKRSGNLLLTDATFKIELALISSLVRTDDQSKMLQQVLDAFPSSSKTPTPTSTSMKLKALQTSTLHALSSDESRAKLSIALGISTSLSSSLLPDTRTMEKDPFIKQVFKKCELFLSFKAKGDDLKIGIDAYNEHLESAKCKLAKKVGKDSDAALLKAYVWVLPEEKRKAALDVAKAIDSITAANPVAPSVASGAASASTPSAGKKSSTSKVDDKSVGFKRALSMLA